MNIVFGLLGVVLLILGCAELARLVAFWATKPAGAERMALVVAPAGPEDCEALVRAGAERVRWMGCGCGLVCLLPEETPELYSICRFLQLQYPYLRVSKKEDLVYHIGEEAG